MAILATLLQIMMVVVKVIWTTMMMIMTTSMLVPAGDWLDRVSIHSDGPKGISP